MTITLKMRGGACLLELEGEFDRTNSGELAAAIDECLQSASSVALDFQPVTFLDGGVLSLLLDVLDGLEGHGWLGVVRPSARMRRLLDIVGLSARGNFRLFPTMEEALEAIDQS